MILDPLDLRARGFMGLRVVGDVHGDAQGFAAAIAGAAAARLFVLQLGDLTDDGPDSPGALRLMLGLLDAGAGLFLLGNHDRKLLRALGGAAPTRGHQGWARTLEQIAACDDAAKLRAGAAREIGAAPAWLRIGRLFFVHAGFHRAMLHEASPREAATARRTAALARALYGQVTGQTNPDGVPARTIEWTDDIPPGLTVFCGHDRRSTDGRPWRVRGRLGGEAVFLDTGAGKGGHLSWLDLPLTGADATAGPPVGS